MKRRWSIYIIIGILFGVVDFFYHGFLSNFIRRTSFSSHSSAEITWLVLSIGIWLVPIIPIALYETRISLSRLWPALATSFTWCASIVAYYLTDAVQLAFLGFSGRPELHISNRGTPFFLENWRNVLWHDIILGGIVEWVLVAFIGGFMVGFLISFFLSLF